MKRTTTGIALVGIVAGLALAASACTPYLVPQGAAPMRYRDEVFSDFTLTSDIPYGAGSAVDQDGNTDVLNLDVYQPAGDTVTYRPAIVWVHGGSFRGGDKTSGELVDEARVFAKKGFVNFSINYRLTNAGCSASAPGTQCVDEIKDAMHDAQAAVRWVKHNAATYGVDPERVAIGGTSAGAITAIEVALNPDQPQGPTDSGFSNTVRAALSLSGANIIGFPDPTDAPFLDWHGTADPLVPYAWAVNTVSSARAVGIDAHLKTYEGEGHVPYNHRQEIHDMSTNFLWWHMDLAHATV
jgi:acetyl esterase/lipase